MSEGCPSCGFMWDGFDPAAVTPRVLRAADQIARELTTNEQLSFTRPALDRWSALEYAAHVRDVLLNVRDRLVLCAIEDNPSPSPLYRDHRVALGLYEDEDLNVVAHELRVAASLFTRTFDLLEPTAGTRTLVYSRDVGLVVTFDWVGAQAVHECEHHLDDVIDVQRLVANGD